MQACVTSGGGKKRRRRKRETLFLSSINCFENLKKEDKTCGDTKIMVSRRRRF